MLYDATLLKSIGLNFSREKVIIGLLIVLPFIMLTAATATMPDQTLDIRIEGVPITPPPTAKSVSVALYALTTVGFIAALTTFFINFHLKRVRPRLQIAGYSSASITTALIIITAIVSTIVTLTVLFFGFLWFTPSSLIGYTVSLVMGAIIFSTIGLILSTVLESKELGLYVLLTLVLLDTGFIEHPFYSRRWDDPYLIILPAHHVVRMVMRSSFAPSGVSPWYTLLPFALFYEVVLIAILLFFVKRKR